MRNAIILIALMAVGLSLYSQDRQSKLAVMEIEDQSDKLDKKMLEAAAEALRTEIGATNKFVLISKERQRAVIKEQKKESWKECYDQSCRIQLGQALAADTVLQSSVNLFGGAYTLTSELIDLAKEATVKTAKAEFDGTEKGLAEAIKSIAGQIAGVKKGSAFQTGKIGEQVESWEIGQGEETIIKFESQPTGASVRVDGKLLCQTTPCSKMLAQGKHEITLELENYLAKTKSGDLKQGTNIRWILEPDFGWIEILSTPSGVEVSLDGKSLGKTPIAKTVVSPGPHQVETTDNCFYQTGEKFVLNRSETKSIALDMKPKEAGIKATAQDKEGNDLEAHVVVDGKEFGITPGKFKVPMCSKEVVVQTGALVYKETLALQEKQIWTVAAVLSPKERYEIQEEVVIDNKTGLMWQKEYGRDRRSASDTMSQEAAEEYCEKLSLYKYTDWRLPSISELKTLIVGCQSATDACKVSDKCLSPSCLSEDACGCKSWRGPGEDGRYWQKGIWSGNNLLFWSSSLAFSGNGDFMWAVGFGSGSISYIGTRDHYDGVARCVRGEMSNNPAFDLEEKAANEKINALKEQERKRYKIQEQVVIDDKTGLMWQRERTYDTGNHSRAIEYCEKLTLGGYTDWRLPTISELKTLIAECQSGTDACKVSDNCLSGGCYSDSCSCGGLAGPGEKGYYWQEGVWTGGAAAGMGRGGFWTSSPLKGGRSDGCFWGVDFRAGSVNSDDYGSSFNSNVRCVRKAEDK